MLQKRDLLWILAYPIYQIIGTIRHEGSHLLLCLYVAIDPQKMDLAQPCNHRDDIAVRELSL